MKDKDSERPSAQQLCERVANLKEKSQYSNYSVAAAQQERQQPQRREGKTTGATERTATTDAAATQRIDSANCARKRECQSG